MALLGIDVADVGQHHVNWLEHLGFLPPHAPSLSRRGQGAIEWEAVFAPSGPDLLGGAADPISWGVAKVSEGVGFDDPQWAANRAGLLAHGKPTAGYHMLGTSPGAAQADHYLSLVGEGVGLAVDVELAGTGGQVRPFLDRVCSRRPGETVLVYSSRGLWSLAGASGVDISGYPVLAWHAGVRNGAYSPASGSLAAIWASVGSLSLSTFGGLPATRTAAVQYTDRASVPGCTGGVDGNCWLASADQLTAWTQGGTVPLTPQDEQAVASAVAYMRLSGIAGQFELGKDPSVGELLHHGVRAGLDVLTAVQALQADVDQLKAGGVDPAAVAAALQPELAALVREAVADVLHSAQA